MAEAITVEVVHVTAQGEVFHRSIALPAGATVAAAIDQSGVLDAIPDLVADPARLGVFSHKVGLEHVLKDGDRVEIYRSLTLDPKEARRRRAR